jgi:hypothetical protein
VISVPSNIIHVAVHMDVEPPVAHVVVVRDQKLFSWTTTFLQSSDFPPRSKLEEAGDGAQPASIPHLRVATSIGIAVVDPATLGRQVVDSGERDDLGGSSALLPEFA